LRSASYYSVLLKSVGNLIKYGKVKSGIAKVKSGIAKVMHVIGRGSTPLSSAKREL
jgi:hypothetical protein